MEDDRYYLYHLRDPERAAGFGLGEYTGTARSPRRRFKEHMGAAAKGAHPNPLIQAMYDESGGRLQMWVMVEGTRDEIHAREGLVVPTANHGFNIQKGGGYLRGKTADELIGLAGLNRRPAPNLPAKAAPPLRANGAVALVALGVIVVAGLLYFLYRRRKRLAAIADVKPVPEQEFLPGISMDQAVQCFIDSAAMARIPVGGAGSAVGAARVDRRRP